MRFDSTIINPFFSPKLAKGLLVLQVLIIIFRGVFPFMSLFQKVDIIQLYTILGVTQQLIVITAWLSLARAIGKKYPFEHAIRYLLWFLVFDSISLVVNLLEIFVRPDGIYLAMVAVKGVGLLFLFIFAFLMITGLPDNLFRMRYGFPILIFATQIFPILMELDLINQWFSVKIGDVKFMPLAYGVNLIFYAVFFWLLNKLDGDTESFDPAHLGLIDEIGKE